ncbi:MAG: VOC family protein [Wenzhouxiangellaceae bacterium]
MNQVTLPVRNMDNATAYYRKLGFIQIVDTPHYARFECPEGDSTFSLSLRVRATITSHFRIPLARRLRLLLGREILNVGPATPAVSLGRRNHIQRTTGRANWEVIVARTLSEVEFSNGAIIYFESDRLDEWVAELAAIGIEFDQMPTNMRYLWREAVLHDPSGNKIKLYHAGENRRNPPWREGLREVAD